MYLYLFILNVVFKLGLSPSAHFQIILLFVTLKGTYGLSICLNDTSPISLLVQESQRKENNRSQNKGRKNPLLDDTGAGYEEVKKDSSALSKEEQMGVLHR